MERLQLLFDVKSFLINLVDAEVSSKGETWRLTGFYGNPNNTDRFLNQELIRTLKVQSQLPWLFFGDLNEILFTSEKKGRPKRSNARMEAFRNICDDCGWRDLGYKGPNLHDGIINRKKIMLDVVWIEPLQLMGGAINFLELRSLIKL
ncbi:Uncharacterized protein TCM_001468 [Theobroma cacao]|uniref:Exo_endo_phos domain-containing protein n=1 Tax=Theobroma cacao TaxID=3641 RepID=A0A061DJJ5_THECC|nr:Uncharacterized protein TCM_001468 [Theobroma cacao]